MSNILITNFTFFKQSAIDGKPIPKILLSFSTKSTPFIITFRLHFPQCFIHHIHIHGIHLFHLQSLYYTTNSTMFNKNGNGVYVHDWIFKCVWSIWTITWDYISKFCIIFFLHTRPTSHLETWFELFIYLLFKQNL